MVTGTRPLTSSVEELSWLARRQAVRALAAWQPVDHDELLSACDGGVLVVRLERGLEPAASSSWADRAGAVCRQPYLGFAAWVRVRSLLDRAGRLACVVTVSGYPVLLGDLVGLGARLGDQVRIELEPPGEWADVLQGRRLVTPPGPAWQVLGGPRRAGCAAARPDVGVAANAGRSTTWSRWA
ncbi:MAG: hypothetical protein QM747_11845 [Nocardioides sp.]